jgi:SulP family sulfate permease
LIASTQIRDFLGLELAAVPGDFLGLAKALVEHAGTVSATATALATATVVAILIPGSILVLLLGSAIALAAGLPIDTIGTRFGGFQAISPSSNCLDSGQISFSRCSLQH